MSRSRGAVWLPDDTIILAGSADAGLSRVSASGGSLEPVTSLDASAKEASHRWPSVLPDGQTILFASYTRVAGNFSDAVIEAVDLRSGARKVLLRGGTVPRYVPSGHLVFVREGALFGVPFDPDRVEITGSAVPVLPLVRWDRADGGAQVAFSARGDLFYVRGDPPTPTYSVLAVDRDGKTTPILPEPGTYANPRFSPNGRYLSLTVWKDRNWDIWLYDLTREVFTRLTFHEAAETEQVWSPDGEYLAFSSDRDGRDQVFRKRWDGSGGEELLAAADVDLYASSWAANGTLLATGGVFDVYTLSLEDKTVQPFLAEAYDEKDAIFSPDGRWVAYMSRQSGRPEIYVRPFAGGGRWQISDGGGAYPRWSPDGRELFYRTDEGVMAAAIDVEGGGIRTGRTRAIVRGPFLGGLSGVTVGGLSFPDYDVSPDGKRIAMFPRVDDPGTTGPAVVTMVTNWFDELKQKTASGR